MSQSPTICFCFGYSEADIVADVQAHGRSTIMERIVREKAQHGCNCATTNPKGRCCLADVRQVVDRTLGRTALEARP